MDPRMYGMTHELLKEKILKAVNGRPPIGMRPTWAEFIRSKGTEFFIRDEWVKNKAFFQWLMEQPSLDLSCREDGIGIRIMRFGNGPYVEKEINHG